MLDTPFPYFGGKSKIADIVWKRLGDVPNYVEPFFGSGAVLLRRPYVPKIELVNDKDGMVSNFWRSVCQDPEQTAYHADWPVNECDLHARHAWLVGQKESLQSKLEGDPDYFDVKIAGWWAWGMSCWIGSGFCSGQGPWHVVGGKLINTNNDGNGICRKLVHLGDTGVGVNRIARPELLDWFTDLSNRLRHVRVCCGDWTRVLGPSPTFWLGLTGIFLDPPYSQKLRDTTLYRIEDDISAAVKGWAIANGNNPLLRIALCGYENEHEMPDSWDTYHWQTNGGYGLQGKGRGRENREKEVVWFSPHCLKGELQGRLK